MHNSILTFFSIVLLTMATFTSVVAMDADVGDKVKFILPAITALTSVAAGFLGVFKVADKKRTYRESAEEIKALATDYWENVRLATSDTDKISELQTNLLNDDINAVIKEEKRVISALEQKEKGV